MSTRPLALALLAAAACVGLAVACDDSSSAVKEPAPGIDSGPPPGTPPPQPPGDIIDAGTLPDGAPADCFMNPTTHFEIINACTSAVKIAKNPTLPLLYADGGLPPTP